LVTDKQWIKGEPTIREVVSDPIVHLVMQRDGLTPADLRKAILTAQIRMRRSPGMKLTAGRDSRIREEASAA